MGLVNRRCARNVHQKPAGQPVEDRSRGCVRSIQTQRLQSQGQRGFLIQQYDFGDVRLDRQRPRTLDRVQLRDGEKHVQRRERPAGQQHRPRPILLLHGPAGGIAELVAQRQFDRRRAWPEFE